MNTTFPLRAARLFSPWLCLALAVALALSGCADAQLAAVPAQGVDIDPSGRVASIEGGGLIVRAGQVETPYNLDRKITTFQLTIINPTDQAVEFLPKDLVLFDSTGGQHYPLTPDALMEAASSGSTVAPRTFISMGYGVGYPRYSGYWGYRWYDPWVDAPSYSGRSYEGLIARAFQIRPMTVFPGANISGLVYYPIPAKDLYSAQLTVTRFLRKPSQSDPNPPEFSYHFRFQLTKS
ncbi:MAG: hypothetical protein GC154_14065 [bacterium]|nr:hypothetical protein [bacterium]